MKIIQKLLKKTAGKPAWIRAFVLALLVLLLTGLITAGLVLLIWLPPHIRAVPFWPLILWGCMVFAAIALLLWKRFKSWGEPKGLKEGDWIDGLHFGQQNDIREIAHWYNMPALSDYNWLEYRNGGLHVRHWREEQPVKKAISLDTFMCRLKVTYSHKSLF